MLNETIMITIFVGNFLFIPVYGYVCHCYIEFEFIGMFSVIGIDRYSRRAGFISEQGVYESPRPSSHVVLRDKLS